MAIGFRNNVGFKIEDRKVDSEGRLLFLRGTVSGIKYTLANVYCPNKHPKKYLLEILKELGEFKKGYLILAGDLNFTMDSKLDSTFGVVDKEKKY